MQSERSVSLLQMARTSPQHKAQYERFIDPHYAHVPQVDPGAERRRFQDVLDKCLADLPDEGTPADQYEYSTHMGAFVRTLDQAKDHWVKALLAFYAARGSASPPQ